MFFEALDCFGALAMTVAIEYYPGQTSRFDPRACQARKINT